MGLPKVTAYDALSPFPCLHPRPLRCQAPPQDGLAIAAQ
jgi:hypothetical protein